MIIKKFKAKTEAEALSIARSEMGDNVVLMSSKSVKRQGFFSFLFKPMVEITVGMEEESEKQITEAFSQIAKTIGAPSRNEINSGISAMNPSLSANAVKAYGVGSSINLSTPNTGNKFEELNKEVIPMAAPSDSYVSSKTNNEPTSENVLEKRLDNLQNLLEKQFTKENKENDFPQNDDARLTFLKLIYKTLIDNEVDERYVNELMDEIGKIDNPSTNIDILLANIYQKMILKFGQPATIAVDSTDKQRVVFFVGPTGVGKTTTIAKIASQLCVNHKKKIALLTTDTYRIAAAEQLKTYAGILDVPFRVIYTEEEMNTALSDFKDYGYILVDTAGHSHHNEEQKISMAHFLNSLKDTVEKDTYLVLSATTKYRDLLSIADAYSAFTDYKLIFTKLDETTTFGNLFNICMHTGASMSYITTGQNVPDDIEEFSPQATVKQLLGGK